MSDDTERSVASAGSQPVAWAAVGKNGVPMWLAYHRQDAEGAVVGMAEVVPLYRSPMLTDAERDAVGRAAMLIDDTVIDDSDLALNDYQALRGLYERTQREPSN